MADLLYPLQGLLTAGLADQAGPDAGGGCAPPLLLAGGWGWVAPPAEASPWIRRAVDAALRAEPAVAAVVGAAITPVSRRQKQNPPALTYQLAANTRQYTLSGPLGKSVARFQFVCYSKTALDGEAVADAIRNLLDGFSTPRGSGLLGGLADVDWAAHQGEADARETAADGSDLGTFETAVEFLIRYREPKAR